VNYIGLISVLTSSIQELNEKVRELESEKRENNAVAGEKKFDEEVDFTMDQNIPNPFNSQATISYTVPRGAKANISIFDMSGKYIREYNLTEQKGELLINSSEIGKGMFIYSLISEGKIMVTKKMIVK
jgi:hypothetical protein